MMAPSPGDDVPTRLVDVSRLGLSALGSLDVQDVARASALLVDEVSHLATVSLAGSNS
jgi:hypothetical protein